MSKNSLIIMCCILFIVIAVLVHMLKEFKWYQKSYYELGYESGRFEVEVKNLFLSGGLTTYEKGFLKRCEYIAMFEVNEKEV